MFTQLSRSWLRRSVVASAVATAAFVAAALTTVPGTDDTAFAARPASQAAVAKKLVRDVRASRTDAARTAALTRMFRALEIGVTTPSGRPIVVPVTPRQSSTFHLYDFEVRMLARQLKRGKLRSPDLLANSLTEDGLEIAPGKPFPAALLTTSVRDAIRGANRNPRATRALLPLILRELGMTRPKATRQDLARVPPARMQFDALQAMLVGTDVRLSVLSHIGGAKVGARSAPAPRAGRALPADCAAFSDAVEKAEKLLEQQHGGKVQKVIADKAYGMVADQVTGQLDRQATRWAIRNLPGWATRGIYTGRKALALAEQLKDGLHGSLLAYSIQVEPVKTHVQTHYGHDGKPGEQMVFQIRVRSLDDWGEMAAKCGKLAGTQLPQRGGIEGVPVAWEKAEGQLAPEHGTVDCAKPLCITKTNGSGIAQLVFTPKSEKPFATLYMEQEAVGNVSGTALYQTGMDAGIVGQIAQVLIPKYAHIQWRVRYHEVPGIRIRGSLSENVNSWQSSQASLDLLICDPDPYTMPAPITAMKGTIRWWGTKRSGDQVNPFDITQAVTGSPRPFIHGIHDEGMWLHAQYWPAPAGVRSLWWVTIDPSVEDHPTGWTFEVLIWPEDGSAAVPKVAFRNLTGIGGGSMVAIESANVTVTAATEQECPPPAAAA